MFKTLIQKTAVTDVFIRTSPSPASSCASGDLARLQPGGEPAAAQVRSLRGTERNARISPVCWAAYLPDGRPGGRGTSAAYIVILKDRRIPANVDVTPASRHKSILWRGRRALADEPLRDRKFCARSRSAGSPEILLVIVGSPGDRGHRAGRRGRGHPLLALRRASITSKRALDALIFSARGARVITLTVDATIKHSIGGGALQSVVSLTLLQESAMTLDCSRLCSDENWLRAHQWSDWPDSVVTLSAGWALRSRVRWLDQYTVLRMWTQHLPAAGIPRFCRVWCTACSLGFWLCRWCCSPRWGRR